MKIFYSGIAHYLLVIIITSIQIVTNVALADAGGRFQVPDLPFGATIDVNDATLGTNWPAGELPITIIPITGPSGSGKMFIKHPDDPMQDEELYVFIQVDDGSPNTGPTNIDELVLMFDLSHDHAVASPASFITSDDRGILFKRDGSVQRIYGQITTPALDEDTTDFPATRKSIVSDGTNWKIEARLLPSDLGLNGFNALVGATVLARDLNTGNSISGRWPNTATANPNTWANLITRRPIDYALLIDQSGSMSGAKWDSAKRAGNNFALILSKMKDPTLDSEFSALFTQGDRLGLANFTWGVDDASTILKSLATIPAVPGDYTSVLPASPGGWTPIAAGINKAVEMFGGRANLSADPRTRIVMLLTDGQHNRPNPTIKYTTNPPDPLGDFTYVPSPCGTNSLVRVNPIAVGTDATVDPATLNDIKNCFSGKAFTQPGGGALNIYNIVNPNEPQLTAQLTRYYVETLTPYFRWNILSDTPGLAPNFSLMAGERKLLLFAFWANKGDAVPLTITKPDATVATGTSDTNLGYSFLTIDNPPSGEYNNFVATGATRSMVLLDLRVEARFAIDNQPHDTGSTITLKSRLREDGKPITGADVRVDIVRPEEGFGTYVSTHTLQSCESRPPQLPPIDVVLRAFSLGTTKLFTEGFELGAATEFAFPGMTVTPPSSATGSALDVPAPRFSLIEQLFKKCNKSGLVRAEDPGLKLFDDGTHGDAIANDGFYTLSFENTRFQGSYVFRFLANGTAADGSSFTRIREIGEYVQINVNPAQTPVGSRIIQQTGNLLVEEFHVTPRDRFGGYLGPGYPDQIQFYTTGGQWISAVNDYNNGIYSRFLRYDQTQVQPDVIPVVQGKPIVSKPWWYKLHRCLEKWKKWIFHLKS